ncbi:MAG: hypothetical protein A2017_09560 [Lentisphaerae bacterium GWF2_44_16]|nr:MAG: hypothetical protein A2017_09560 [Lentisphaerae bacterium GWF2_44_16]
MKFEHKIIKSEIIETGKWLCLRRIFYSDAKGISRTWESVERLKCSGAVVLIAFLRPSNRILLIRQYRPPVASYVIEFPAGLIDEGETAEAAAERELFEETGYRGKMIRFYPPSFNSGLSGETVQIAFVEIDENSELNHSVAQSLDESEDIELIPVEMSKLADFLEKAVENGDKIDSKLHAFSISREC